MPRLRLLTLIAAVLVVIVALADGKALAATPADRLLAPESACPHQGDAAASVEAQEAAMLCLVRHARRLAKVPALQTNPKLADAAGRKARDVLRCDVFSHTACGRHFNHHLRAVGYWTGCGTIGENLAWGAGAHANARAMMAAWLASEPHRRNLLSPRYREHGIGLSVGTLEGQAGAAVWVDHLGVRC